MSDCPNCAALREALRDARYWMKIHLEFLEATPKDKQAPDHDEAVELWSEMVSDADAALAERPPDTTISREPVAGRCVCGHNKAVHDKHTHFTRAVNPEATDGCSACGCPFFRQEDETSIGLKDGSLRMVAERPPEPTPEAIADRAVGHCSHIPEKQSPAIRGPTTDEGARRDKFFWVAEHRAPGACGGPCYMYVTECGEVTHTSAIAYAKQFSTKAECEAWINEHALGWGNAAVEHAWMDAAPRESAPEHATGDKK